MKLSEAILLGSIGSEQGFGITSAYQDAKAKCAIGSALLGVGKEANSNDGNPYQILVNEWPWVMTKIEIPEFSVAGPYVERNVMNAIWLLNDIYKWPRPKIAAWIAELEAIYDPQPTPIEVPCEVTTT